MRLKQKTAFGFIWVGVSFTIVQILSFISSVILARLLAPQHFGQFALVNVIIFFVATLGELGIGAALIQVKDSDQETIDTAFTILVVLSVSLSVVTFILSPLIASLFDETAISSPLRVMTAVILLTSLRVTPASLLERDLEFKRKIVAEILPLLGSIIVSIALAMAETGVWSLVGGAVFSSILSAFLIWRITSFRPRLRFNIAIVRRLLGFGQHIALGTMLLYAVVNLDRLYIGYFADATTLGYYGLGLTVSNWLGNVAPLVNRVMFPAFSRSQGTRQVIGEAYLKIFRFISLALLPVAWGIFLIAPRIVLVIYGEKWLPAVTFIRILIFYGLLRGFNGLIGPVFASAGKPSLSVRIVVLRLFLLFPLVFVLGTKLNSIGVGLATTMAMALATVYALMLAANELRLHLRQIAGCIFIPFLATVIMGVGVNAVSSLMPMNILAIITLIALGACLYFGSLLILTRQQILREAKEALGLLFPAIPGTEDESKTQWA